MKKLVIKIGSSFFINKNEINRDNIRALAEQISFIKQKGIACCLISSGAIAVGVKKMGFKIKPTNIAKKQACAAIGQMSLMQEYEQIFDNYNIKCAQILLNHDDFGNRNRITSLQQTMETLLQMGVVPVVNENDALAVEEIKVGDNDTLSAMTSLVISADLLVLVSDIDGLFTANPKIDPLAKKIDIVHKIDDTIKEMAGGAGSSFGTGGMCTKIRAGEITTNANIPMMIVNKNKISQLSSVVDGDNLGTLFKASSSLSIRESWIKYCANVKGKLTIDNGASIALNNRKSLLAVGIKQVEGSFKHGEVVEICLENKTVIAKGISLFDNMQIKKFIDKEHIKNQVVVHANDLVINGD